MTDLLQLVERHNIQVEAFHRADVSLPLMKIRVPGKRPVTLIMTNGLSEKIMQIPEHSNEARSVELYWTLPDYWEVDEQDSRLNWIYTWLNKLIRHLLDNDVWYGHGHTFQSGQLSPTMKQDYLMLAKPLMVEDVLAPLLTEKEGLGFLAIVPLFKTEFEFKQRKGTNSLVTKMTEGGVYEILDDYRESLLKKRFGYLR